MLLVNNQTSVLLLQLSVQFFLLYRPQKFVRLIYNIKQPHFGNFFHIKIMEGFSVSYYAYNSSVLPNSSVSLLNFAYHLLLLSIFF